MSDTLRDRIAREFMAYSEAESLDDRDELYLSPLEFADVAMRAESLDAAWAEAEAALPKGVGLELLYLGSLVPDRYGARAFDGKRLPSLALAGGPTPAAALRGLTAKLRERAG